MNDFVNNMGRDICVTSDGKHVVTGSSQKTIRIFRIEDKKLVREINEHTESIWSVYVTLDCKYVVTGSEGKTIRITRIEYGMLVREIKGRHIGHVSNVCVTPDGKHVVSACYTYTDIDYENENPMVFIHITRIKDGMLVREIRVDGDDDVERLCVTPGGKHLVYNTYRTIVVQGFRRNYIMYNYTYNTLYNDFCVTPDGKQVVAYDEPRIIVMNFVHLYAT